MPRFERVTIFFLVMNFTLGIQPIDYASCNKRADLRPSTNHLHTQPHTSVAQSPESSSYGIAIEADAKICHSGNCYRQVAVNRYLAKESSSEARCRHRSIGKCTDVSLNPGYSGANVRIAECRDHRVVSSPVNDALQQLRGAHVHSHRTTCVPLSCSSP